MCGMKIGKRLAEKRMSNTADIRKDIRFLLEWHLICAILSEGKHDNNIDIIVTEGKHKINIIPGIYTVIPGREY